MKNTRSTTAEGARGSVTLIEVQNPERRGQLRLVPDALSAILSTGQQSSVVYIEDISFEGAKIRNAPPGLVVGDVLKLITGLEGHEAIALQCRIMHIAGNMAQIEAGVRFENVEDAESCALISYLKQLLAGSIEGTDTILAP